jgi:hypothetical protein
MQGRYSKSKYTQPRAEMVHVRRVHRHGCSQYGFRDRVRCEAGSFPLSRLCLVLVVSGILV